MGRSNSLNRKIHVISYIILKTIPRDLMKSLLTDLLKLIFLRIPIFTFETFAQENAENTLRNSHKRCQNLQKNMQNIFL